MKTIMIYSAALLLGTAASAQSPANEKPDSLHIHIVQQKNGKHVVIDTVVAASQQEEISQYLQMRGIYLPAPPPVPDSANKMVMLHMQRFGTDSGMIFREIDGPPVLVDGMVFIDSDAPFPPPLPPMPPDALSPLESLESLPPMPPMPPMHEMRIYHAAPGDSALGFETIIICDSAAGKGAGRKCIVHTTAPGTPPPPPAKRREAPPAEMLTVFPNPSTGRITLSFEIPGPGKTIICITDANGKVVYREETGEQFAGKYVNEIDLSKNGKGIYNIEVRKADMILVRRVVVQ
jgi:hypothetical protein